MSANASWFVSVFAVEPVGKDLQRCLERGEKVYSGPNKFLDTVADSIRIQQVRLDPVFTSVNGCSALPYLLSCIGDHLFSLLFLLIMKWFCGLYSHKLGFNFFSNYTVVSVLFHSHK